MTNIVGGDFGFVWKQLLEELLQFGKPLTTRDMNTYELINVHLSIADPLDNILVNKARAPNYRFMIAEWLWIWFGHDDVETIGKYNKNILAFSDDGVTFAGNYGKPLTQQWDLVRTRLQEDPYTRQAILQIFRHTGTRTVDVPCTLSIQFLIRGERLCTIVNMRSSDVWLGLPYDTFNFSMFANVMAAQLGVRLGWLAYNLGSSHLYETNHAAALDCLREPIGAMRSPVLESAPPAWLEKVLTSGELPYHTQNDEPWHSYGRALIAGHSKFARKELSWLSDSQKNGTSSNS